MDHFEDQLNGSGNSPDGSVGILNWSEDLMDYLMGRLDGLVKAHWTNRRTLGMGTVPLSGSGTLLDGSVHTRDRNKYVSRDSLSRLGSLLSQAIHRNY